MRWLLVLCVLVAIAVHTTRAVDRSKFKKCEDLGFCRRNRNLAKETKPSPYALKGGISGKGWRSKEKVATVLNKATGVEYNVELIGYQGGVFRLMMRESSPLRARYEVHKEVVLPEFADSSNQVGLEVTDASGIYTIKIDSVPDLTVEIDSSLRMKFIRNGQTIMVANARGLLSYEHTRKAGQEQPPANGNYKAVDSSDGGWEERFGSHTDTKPHGPASVGLDFSFPGSSHVYGLPMHTTDFSLPATTSNGHNDEYLRDPYRFYNLDVFEYELDETMAVYGSIPLIISHSAEATVGVLWMNAAETWVDVAKDKGNNVVDTHWYSETGILDVFFLLGPSPAEVMGQIVDVTGRIDMPPAFSLGYHQCRWNYKDEEDVAAVHAGFDTHDIPVDVFWLDIEHTDGKRYFTWDKAHFPTPKDMQAAVEAKGRKMVTIVDPHIKRDAGYYVHDEAESRNYYVMDKSGEKAFDGWCWPGSSSWLDYTNPDVYNYWVGLFEYDKYEGSTPILHVWNDMNEPSVFNGPEITMQKDNLHYGGVEHRELHNLYGYLNQKATAEGLVMRNADHNQRSFVLSRAFFAGSQRWGSVWTGDNMGTWEHLDNSQAQLLSLSISGLPFVGGDVGGFFGNPEPELLLRWYQAAAFHPFYRGHAHLDTKRREPWLFGDPWTGHIRKAIRTRYSYIPYMYTLFAEARLTGMPMMRPLWMEFPKEESVFEEQSAFMLGNALLVRPVVRAGQSSVQLRLPGKEAWYDTESYYRYNAPQTVSVDAPLEKIPVYQRSGTIVPKQERARRSTTQMHWDPITLNVAVDEDGHASGALYMDDGHTFNYRKGDSMRALFTYRDGVLRSVPEGTDKYAPSNVVERVRVVGLRDANEVSAVLLADNSRLSFVVEANDVLVIRKPSVPISEPWEIKIVTK